MFHLINLNSHSDTSGRLIVLEEPNSLPFLVRRNYFISNTNTIEPRGFHAHKSQKQIIIALNGSVDITLDDGKNKETIVLNDPTKAIYIEGIVWREMKNFNNCILSVLCDSLYCEDDYIRDYNEFIKITNKK